MVKHTDPAKRALTKPKPSIFSLPILLATWFGFGRLPIMPGTWGSLAALPFAWFIYMLTGPVGLALITVIVFFLGMWAAGVYRKAANDNDPESVVIDEVVGQWLTLALAAPLDPLFFAMGFFFFRLFDILKPWPVSWADQRLEGGFGIMIDDIIAACYAAAVLAMLGYFMGVYC